jgi:hypothetical protein
MVMRLVPRQSDHNKATFRADPPDPAVADEVIEQAASGVSFAAFRACQRGTPTKEEFETKLETERPDTDPLEFLGRLGKSNPDVGFGAVQVPAQSPIALKMKKEAEKDAEKDKT